ncbi:PREDICTED: protein disulfide-isomerase A3-like [Acropora digitifera]|uniref:protein disulfide-isomerase A3-like n=1 Tax=Acropora digitifera TaxID=70779 RepID=UPI00077B1A4F|nr:PREDICTED: protein disulfide-isomerase A3-like [Acropora digitifera]
MFISNVGSKILKVRDSKFHLEVFPFGRGTMLISGFLLSLFVSFAVCSDVVELTDGSFKSEVDGKEIMLVEFFAPWCGHCKKLAPEYEEAATKLKVNDPPIPLAKVCKTHFYLLQVVLFWRIHYCLVKSSTPESTTGDFIEINTLEELNKKLESDTAVIVGFFDKDDEIKTEYMTVADQLRESHTFAHTSSEEVMAELGHRDAMVIFRPKHLNSKFEPNKEVFSGTETSFYMKKFIEETVHGMVGHMTSENEAQFKKPVCVVYFKVDYKLNPKGTNYWRNRVLKVATEFQNKVMKFAIASKPDFQRFLSDVGFKTDDEEVNVVIRSDDGSKYKMTEKFSVDNFKAFLTQYFNAEITPYIKSEAVPEENDGPVKVVVGQTFEEIVNDPDKDVLIEFYAPWCGHCKNLEPIYKELGEKVGHFFKHYNRFPTIYFAPMNNKDKPLKYAGARDVDSFVEYLQREATNTFKLPSAGKKKKSKKSKDEL